MKVFEDTAMRCLKGLMYHRQLEDYFRFLGFDDLARIQRERYLEESDGFARVCTCYLQGTGKLLKFDDPKVESLIPPSWYQHVKNDVDTSTRKSHLKQAMDFWVNWEREVLEAHDASALQMDRDGLRLMSLFFCRMLNDVRDELAFAERLREELQITEYDPADALSISAKYASHLKEA